MMTDKEVLKKAIKKARENGWEANTGRYVYLMSYLFGNPNCFSGENLMYELAMSNVYKLLFSHDFAKAFWGEDQKTFKIPYWIRTSDRKDYPDKPITSERKYRNEINILWKHHLMRMVLQENPIDYLRKFVDNAENPLK